MRTRFPEKLEAGRVREGIMASDSRDGGYGAFFVHGPCGEELKIIASAAHPTDVTSAGWEHVSVSIRRRVPNWQEMCFVKGLFWEPTEYVVQFHPPETEYVNNHPNCLHLWRYTKAAFPLPPSILVGIKSEGVLTEARAAELHREQLR